ncbi:EcsC family protein [Metabacillus herbersteinensis]|uniref:EcsC family protein n=1 Tax=Metabacillus herbersteinensis TaxID=283816 RepID=A0ABV6G9Z8_9BACI
MDSTRNQEILNEIYAWEAGLQEDHRSDFIRTFNKWLNNKMENIPESAKKLFLETFDKSLFYLHSFIQNTQIQQDARNQILLSARALNQDIKTFEDLQSLSLDQLHYISDLQTSKHRLYSLMQGGLTGTGGLLLAGVDVPAQTVLNLRAVQMVSMCYGFEVNTPYEMMTSLKVYHASLMPKHLKYKQWLSLKEELNENEYSRYFYEGIEELADEASLEFLAKQIVKLSAISLVKKKTLQGIPLLSIVIGASMNYRLTRQVTDFANNYYQYRLILKTSELDQLHNY